MTERATNSTPVPALERRGAAVTVVVAARARAARATVVLGFSCIITSIGWN